MPLSSLWLALSRWWRNDRIRVSPRDGAILRLTPSAVVLIRDVAFQVVARRVVSLPGGAAIVYDCDSERARCQLRVEPRSPRARLVLIEAATEIPLADDDVEVFPARQ